MAYCLEGLAWAARRAGDPVRAARLLGAAEGLRAIIDSPIVVGNQEGHRAEVAALRDGLDTRVFRQARAVGRYRPLAEAVTAALTLSSWATKQFAMLQPSTTSRLDLGLILPLTTPATGRLESAAKFNPLFTHRVRITAVSDLDDELRGWLATATYSRDSHSATWPLSHANRGGGQREARQVRMR